MPVTAAAQQLNESGLRAVMAMIERNLERWNQNVFAGSEHPNTTHCLAGWTLKLAGVDVYEVLQTEGRWAVFAKAQALLGLTERQAARIFLYFEDSRTGEHPTWYRFKQRVISVTGIEL